MKLTYKTTIRSCFCGFIVQAIVNNFAPLLFLTFEQSLGVSLSKITLLVSINFGIQLLIDFLSVFFVDKLGYRLSFVLSHFFSASGLIFLAILPYVLPDPFTGLIISSVTYAIGGGLLEVVGNPIMDSCPSDNKEKSMSLLHSFYCWGHVGVVLISTGFFWLFGINEWRILSCLWAILPIANGILFSFVPLPEKSEESGDCNAEGFSREYSLKNLLLNGRFILFVLLMAFAGASEQAMSQWASAFAEQGLNLSKTVGDLCGPLVFALAMGISRAFFGSFGNKIRLGRFMLVSGVLCVASYVLVSCVNVPVIGFIGCGLCGLSVGIMWPGTVAKSAKLFRDYGTKSFALLSFGGDIGCISGPLLVGLVSSSNGDDFKKGLLFSSLFPIAFTVILFIILLSLLPKKDKRLPKSL